MVISLLVVSFASPSPPFLFQFAVSHAYYGKNKLIDLAEHSVHVEITSRQEILVYVNDVVHKQEAEDNNTQLRCSQIDVFKVRRPLPFPLTVPLAESL